MTEDHSVSRLRVECPRHHWQFSVTAEGIAYKCRAGECRVVYTVPWEEIDAKRQQVTREQIQSLYTVTPAMIGELREG